jgi:hypothetical protein
VTSRRKMSPEGTSPVRDHDKFMLRLPDGMRSRVTEAAKENGRSMNAEIVAVLEEKFPAPIPEADLHKMIGDLMRQLESASPEERAAIHKALGPLWKQVGSVFD